MNKIIWIILGVIMILSLVGCDQATIMQELSTATVWVVEQQGSGQGSIYYISKTLNQGMTYAHMWVIITGGINSQIYTSGNLTDQSTINRAITSMILNPEARQITFQDVPSEIKTLIGTKIAFYMAQNSAGLITPFFIPVNPQDPTGLFPAPEAY